MLHKHRQYFNIKKFDDIHKTILDELDTATISDDFFHHVTQYLHIITLSSVITPFQLFYK